MKTLRGFMLGSALTLLLIGNRASAQGVIPSYVFLRDSSGLIYLTSSDQRVNIPIYPATDEQIQAVPLLDKWMLPAANGDGFEIGNRPDWAWSPSAPLAVAAPAPPAPAAPAAPTWQTIAKWSGQGSKTTEPFSVNGQWRVIATATQGRVSNQLCLTAKRVTDGRLGINGCLYGGGETYNSVGQTSGSYQMEISGTSGSNWTVEVQALQ